MARQRDRLGLQASPAAFVSALTGSARPGLPVEGNPDPRYGAGVASAMTGTQTGTSANGDPT